MPLEEHEPIRKALDRAGENYSPKVLKRVSGRGQFILGLVALSPRPDIKIRKARKDYTCVCCDEPIKKGDSYACYRSGVEPNGWKMRLECL